MFIKENSWHFWIYSFFTSQSYTSMQRGWHQPNFCKYARVITLGMLLFSFFAMLAASAVFSILVFWIVCIVKGFGFYFYVKELHGVEAMGMVGLILQAILLVIGAIFCVHEGVTYLSDRRRKKRNGTTPEPGFVSTLYTAHKQKFCPNLEFAPEQHGANDWD
jgi:hypothetical protein